MNKSLKIGLAALPIIGVVAGASTFLAISLKDKKDTKEIDNEVAEPGPPKIGSNPAQHVSALYDSLDIFPEIYPNLFYSYIRMSEDEPIINNDMIAYITSYILKNSMITDGETSWGYYQPNPGEVYIKINWKPAYSLESKAYSRTYHFTLEKDV